MIELAELKKEIVGNVFLSTCYVVYCGPYTGSFRNKLMAICIEKLKEIGMSCSENFDVKNVIGDSLEIAEWIGYGLPKDNVSINSAIMVRRCLQNPMMIDPQLQASRWIRNMLRHDDLVHLKIGSDSFLKMLESALRMRNPIIIETSENSIDPSI